MRFARLAPTLALALLAADAAASVEGVVTAADGKPAANAAVLLVEPDDSPDIINGHVENLYGADLSSTDAAGRFRFSATPADAYRLIALGESGYGESAVAHAGDAVPAVSLSPWAKIEGTAMVGGKPCPGASISGHCDATLAEGWKIVPAADHWIEVNADATGHFKLDSLKPGRWTVQQGIPFHASDRPYPSHGIHADVAAGATATVQIGGAGRTIVGRIELPVLDPPAVANLAFIQNDWGTTAEPPATYGEVQAMTQPEREALAETAAFQEYERQSWAGYERRCFRAFTVQADGTFRIDDVPPGDYPHLYVEVRQPGDGGAKLEVERSIVLPPGDDPFDVGALLLKAVVNLAVGDLVPDVSFRTVDGEPHKLSDFRGKFVLLDVWATWCGPCVGETPNVKAAQDEFGQNARFAVVGLSMDDSPDAPRDYAKAKGLTWTNGFIGKYDQTDVDDQLGIGGIPDIRLIGPDGKLVAKGLRGDGIRAAVDKALNPPTTRPSQ